MSPPPLQGVIVFQDVSFLQVFHPKLLTHFRSIPFVLDCHYFSWPSRSSESLLFVLTGCINTLHAASGFCIYRQACPCKSEPDDANVPSTRVTKRGRSQLRFRPPHVRLQHLFRWVWECTGGRRRGGCTRRLRIKSYETGKD
jgi:hypothetical protein